MEPLMKKSFHV